MKVITQLIKHFRNQLTETDMEYLIESGFWPRPPKEHIDEPLGTHHEWQAHLDSVETDDYVVKQRNKHRTKFVRCRRQKPRLRVDNERMLEIRKAMVRVHDMYLRCYKIERRFVSWRYGFDDMPICDALWDHYMNLRVQFIDLKYPI